MSQQRGRQLSPLGFALLVASLGACVGATQQLPLEPQSQRAFAHGTLQVERIEGGQRLVVVELADLVPPERVSMGGAEYVVWLDAEPGAATRAGTLRYDRERRAGMLMATTPLRRFTVRVMAEMPGSSSAVLVAERAYSSD